LKDLASFGPNALLFEYYFMKKLLLFAVCAASLGLGACNKQTCPAYSSAKPQTTSGPVSASTAVAAR